MAKRKVYMNSDEFNYFKMLNYDKNLNNEINDLDIIFL